MTDMPPISRLESRPLMSVIELDSICSDCKIISICLPDCSETEDPG